MKTSNKISGWAPFFAALLAFVTYFHVLSAFADPMSDYCGHVYTYIPLLEENPLKGGWMSIPYFLWHLHVLFLHRIMQVPVEISAALASGFFAVFSLFVTYTIIEKYTKAKSVTLSPFIMAAVAYLLSTIQCIDLNWTDVGQGFSMNPIHNPTQMCVKPFSLICFCIVYDIFEKLRNEHHAGIFISTEKGLKKAYITLTIVLFLSGMAKPTFAEMFIPTVGLLMLYEGFRRLIAKEKAGAYWKELCKMFLCAVPVLLYILVQFLAYFVFGGSYGLEESSVVITEWMQVWKIFSENIPASILLTIGFPLWVIMIDGRFFLKDNFGRIALAGYGVGLLEAALLGEETKLGHGDFLWPMLSAVLILWVVATLRFLVLCNRAEATGFRKVLLQIGYFIFFAFAFWGTLELYPVVMDMVLP